MATSRLRAGWGAYDQARADNALLRRKERAWKEVLRDFVARLHSGELLATGLFAPLGAESERRVIQPELWSVLTPHFGRSSAKGGGCEVFGLRVMLSTDVRTIETAAEAADDVFGRGLVGRPSCMPAIEAEMRARADRNELCGTWAEECQHLAEWASDQFPGRRTPTRKTIRNRLAKVYRQLKGSVPARN